MRISDWSSDVCSSDLSSPRQARPADLAVIGAVAKVQHLALQIAAGVAATVADVIGQPPAGKLGHRKDRKSGASGKRVSVRVDLGGRRIIKKKNRITNEKAHHSTSTKSPT